LKRRRIKIRRNSSSSSNSSSRRRRRKEEEEEKEAYSSCDFITLYMIPVPGNTTENYIFAL